MTYHTPVMLTETLEYINVVSGGKYIDCTLGDAGHTLEILKKGGKVLGLDVNEKALQRATERIKSAGFESNFIGVCKNFKHINNLAEQNGFSKVNGILFDLGYSSSQLADEETGLSFLANQPLDMRLDKELGVTAADLVNALSENDLAKMFLELSDEKFSKRFAKAITEHRNLKKFRTTKELVDVVVSVAPPGYEHGRIHPATRIFQALRIAVNAEIENLEVSLPRAAQTLLPGGRMIVISFHSLEDRAVKSFGRTARLYMKELTDKPLTPSATEISANVRSRSAKMRVYEKIAAYA